MVLPDATVFATANLLYIPAPMPTPMSHMTEIYTERVRQLSAPSVIIGIGLQALIRHDQDIETTIQAMHLQDLSVNLLTAFASRAPPAGIGVRGNITSRLCQKAGIAACNPVGCPSLTINRASNLGAILQEQWKRVVDKLNLETIQLPAASPATVPAQSLRWWLFE